MASPVVAEVVESSTNTAGTNHTVTYPTAVANELWILILDKGSTSATVNAHADWTELLDEASANGLYIAYRWTDGTEGASATLVTSASTRSAQMVYRIQGAANPATTAPQIGTTATGTSATPDPPASAAPPSSKDYLFIAFAGMAGEEADDDTWGNTPPTNYTPSPPRQKSCGTAGTNLGGLIVSAERALTTGSAENPGTFGVDTSAAWRAQTITVHPDLSVTVTPGVASLSLTTFRPLLAISNLVIRGQISTLAQVGSGTSLATSWGTNPFAGSKILVFVQCATVPTSVADNGTSPTTFTLDKSTTAGKGAHIYRADGITLPSSGAYQVTANVSPSGTIQLIGIEYTGAANGGPSATNNGGATSTAVSTGSVTGNTGPVYFGGFSDASGLNPETITFNSGATFTEQAHVTNGSSFWPMAVADAIVSGGGSQSISWTLGDSVAWGAAIATYDPVATGITVTPGVGSLSTTGFAPTVTATANQTVIPGVASLTLSRFAPAVTVGVRVTPGTGSLVTASFAPVIKTPRLVLPGLATLVLTRFAPTVRAGITVIPGVASLVTTRFTPTVALSNNIKVVPGLTSVVISRLTPTVLAPRTAIPGKATLVLTRLTPTVTTSTNIRVTTGLAALALTGLSPTVIGQVLSPISSGLPIFRRKGQTAAALAIALFLEEGEADLVLTAGIAPRSK